MESQAEYKSEYQRDRAEALQRLPAFLRDLTMLMTRHKILIHGQLYFRPTTDGGLTGFARATTDDGVAVLVEEE